MTGGFDLGPIDAAPESAVTVEEIHDDHVVLNLPSDARDAPRVIPQDMVEYGQEALNWFVWDMQKKQPRAPHKNGGYAGCAQWGRDNVSWDARAGSRFRDVMDVLNGKVNGHREDWWSWGQDEGPRDLYPMAIMPHSDFQNEDAPVMLVDLDDVIEPQDDGTGVMTREAWDLIQRLDSYTEVSRSMTGVHVFVKARLPGFVPGKKVMEDLDDAGHVELYGYPADGRIMGTTWMHIDGTPRHSIPDRQDTIDALAGEVLDDDDQMSDKEQTQAAAEKAGVNGSSGNRSEYYNLDLTALVSGTSYTRHGGGMGSGGPHPEHGGTSTPDEKSTNFVAFDDGAWHCHAHGTSGGPIHMIAVMEGIVNCSNAKDATQDPVTCLRACLAARDKYADDGVLDDENPPQTALKGVLDVQDIDYDDDGRLTRGQWESARATFDLMEYQG